MHYSGLSQENIVDIQAVFKKHSNIEKVLLYGSRAKGTFKPSSDIDISLIGKDISLTLLNTIENELDDLLLPYKFDISIYHQIENPDFLDHIQRVGKEFYSVD